MATIRDFVNERTLVAMQKINLDDETYRAELWTDEGVFSYKSSADGDLWSLELEVPREIEGP